MGFNIEIIAEKRFKSIIADEISHSIDDVLSERECCSVALAGGKTPGGIHRLLARPPHVEDIQWDKLRLFLGDERFVAYEDTQSNYRMVRETLLDHLPESASPKVLPVNTSLDSPDAAAKEYASSISGVIDECGGAIDIVLLGLGEDGHFASIFPGQDQLSEVAYATNNPHDGTDRITLSKDVLLNARRIIFMVKGANKAQIVHEVIEQKREEYPATLFHQVADKVTWFIESSAAKELERE